MIEHRDFRREARRRDNPWVGVVFGIGVLAFGVIAWLDRIGRIDGDEYIRWWPLLLIGLALAHAAKRQWIGAAIWLILGLAFMPFLPHFYFQQILGLWPLTISVAGVVLINQALHPAVKDAAHRGSFRAFAWMGGSGRRVSSDDFAGGDAVVVMGACEVNLEHSKIATEAVIDTLAFWGGIEIIVPKEWVVESHVMPLLGGFSNRTNPADSNGPRLIIRGASIMSGIEVRNPKEVTA